MTKVKKKIKAKKPAKKKTVKKPIKPKPPEKHAGGRPSKFNNIKLSEVVFATAKGYTDKQLAKIFGVTEQTINNWKISYPEFFESIKEGKLLADIKVEASLYQRACGYSHPEIHISNYKGRIKRTEIIKHYPPDTAAAFIWLKNRKPQDWRDKKEVDLTANVNIMPTIKIGGKKQKFKVGEDAISD